MTMIVECASSLELGELLDGLAGAGKDTEDVEADLHEIVLVDVSAGMLFPGEGRGEGGSSHSLGERSALANGDLVTLLDTESGRDVCGEVLVAALVTGVLGDEVKVLAADDESAVHLGGDDGSGQDTAADRDLADEGALLVDVGSVNGGLGGLETQTDVLVPSAAVLASAGSLADLLGVLEDVRLLLVSALALDGKFGGHVD